MTFLTFSLPGLVAQEFDPDGKTRLDIRPNDVIIWEGVQAVQDRDGHLLVGLRLRTKDNFSIYKSRLKVQARGGFIASIKSAPTPRLQEDPLGEGQVEVYDGGDFEIELIGTEKYTDSMLSVGVTFLGCTHKICLFPYTEELEIPVYNDTSGISAAASTSEESTGLKDFSSPTDTAATISEAPSTSHLTTEEKYAERLKSGQLPWGIVLLVVFLGGVATNLTPCVFPMIPITLRLLAQQGHARLASTLVYALGIIVTYTGLGLVATLGGGVFGSILANPWVNVGFAIIFVVLGMTMLGFGDLSKLQAFGSQMGAGKSSFLNAFGMGAGAGLVAAPCTGPIMGALLAYATTLNSVGQSLGLFFLYSTGFALPYVFLGMAAKRVTAFKVSPRIQVSVKILFSAAMYALALYYLKNPLQEWIKPVQGYWFKLFIGLLVISLPILILIVRNSSLILRKGVQLAPTILLGCALFAGIQWLSGGDISTKLDWLKDESTAYTEAQKTGRPILIDGWADWCIACKDMDKTTFQDPEVISLLQDEWVIVKLDMTQNTDADMALAEKYGMPGLPTLVLVPADGDLSRSRTLTGYVGAKRLLDELRSFKGK
ncbi:protein-disulfide reductase DsbD family protein [Oligoflexus tunisiensis]|uniref:protein-disulfide reductase DsbD family protein n=1 Tax=Oligoflexus tunisiensis TaxID=708132 RepID=UPI00159F16E8|nr:cytochrome c biogenesis protein CcdA [Oligoflexus tunisiensis]